MIAPMKQVPVAVLSAMLMVACATAPPAGTAMTEAERAKAKKDCITHYAVVGSLGGALLGLLSSGKKDKGKGALLGAAAGGALGAALAWGHCVSLYSDLTSYPMANAQDTARQIGYKSSQGKQIRIQDFQVDPTAMAPGKEVRLAGSYYVMAPEGEKEVKVTETRTVSYYDESEKAWKELGSVDTQITSALGTRRAEGRFELPSDVPDGRYRIDFKIASMGKEDSTSREIWVKKA